jgi:NitT/TauT family transport system ATP-binding protein
VVEAVQLSNRVIIVAYGGRKYAELTIDLPYPRLQTDAAVAAKQAEILALFEEMDRSRPTLDARIAPGRARGQSPLPHQTAVVDQTRVAE